MWLALVGSGAARGYKERLVTAGCPRRGREGQGEAGVCGEAGGNAHAGGGGGSREARENVRVLRLLGPRRGV